MSELRFAPLIRVSTERQEKQGESLHTQKKQIEQYVEQLNGIIPDRCWRYSGQEHATIGQERKNLDQLLSDSSKNLFDCVIVVDASRWSRDNLKSKQGLQILRDNKIRFFVGSSEFDLFDPQATLFLGMSTEMNEYFALEQSRKSLLNRIERTKQGIPSAGKLPYGRTYDRSTNTWGLDKEKVKLVTTAAQRYLSGEGVERIADSMGFNKSHLWTILNLRCGTEWPVNFNSPRLNIKEKVIIEIPALLPKKMVDQIHERAQANKTYLAGHQKHKYLLSSRIYCAECGSSLTGYSVKQNDRYYRYYRHFSNSAKCASFSGIRADQLETDVFWHIYWMIGDKTGFEQAIKNAVPDLKGIENANKRLSQIIFDLKRVSNEKSRILKAIRKGLVDLDDPILKKDLDKLKSRETVLNDEKRSLLATIEKQPSKSEIKNRFNGWQRILKSNYELNEEHLLKMSFSERRALLLSLLAGKDENGQQYGVYVKKDDKFPEHPWYYEIRGNLPAMNDASRIGYDPIGDYDTDAEGQSLVNTYNNLFNVISHSMYQKPHECFLFERQPRYARNRERLETTICRR